jgi:hypothetical protein
VEIERKFPPTVVLTPLEGTVCEAYGPDAQVKYKLFSPTLNKGYTITKYAKRINVHKIPIVTVAGAIS